MSRLIDINEVHNIDIDVSEIRVVAGGGSGEPQEVVIDPKTEAVEVYPEFGKYISKLTVNAVTSEIDANIVQENIRQGVTILGVEGNLATDKPDQVKSVQPTESIQSVKPDAGYELVEVSVGAIPSSYVGSTVPRQGENTYEVSESDRVISAGYYLTGSQTIKGIKLDSKVAIPSTERQTITSDVNGLRDVVIEPIPSNWLDTTDDANIYKGEVEDATN